MGENGVLGGVLSPSGVPSMMIEREEERWRHFDNSVNAVSFGFVATAILISMFLVMAIFERFLRPRSSADGRGGRNGSAGDMEAGIRASSKVGNQSPIDHYPPLDLTVIESSLWGSLIFDALKSKALMFQIIAITFSLLEWTLQIQVEILDLEYQKKCLFFIWLLDNQDRPFRFTSISLPN